MIVKDASKRLSLKVTSSGPRDVGRGLVRLQRTDMQQIDARAGDIVKIDGEKAAFARAMPAILTDSNHGTIQMDGMLRESAGTSLDGLVTVSRAEAVPATSVTLRPRGVRPLSRDLEYISSLFQGVPVQAGSCLRATLFGNEAVEFDVTECEPPTATIIESSTKIQFLTDSTSPVPSAPSFEDVGGVQSQLLRIREMIELPLRFPELFESLGIDPPRGVLLFGAPGCGKTLIARTIARESAANFFTISGPEVIHKFYGESEAHLRKIFEEASRQGPSIIFIDEIDAIAPKRENASGDVERRVVAQLLALMDGLNSRENVIVLAATNLPNSVDPALRRPGRFDREIEIPVPDRSGRRQILAIHTRGMPLADDVNLDDLSGRTHGYVGADLAAFCREAAMACLRRSIDRLDLNAERIPYETLSQLEVNGEDFLQASRLIIPSAIREVYVEVPDTRWEDVGGLDSIKSVIEESILWPLQHADLYSEAGVQPPKGLLLTGPPGVGKTLIAKAAATESQINLISVKGPELLSKMVGESERAVREIFSKARQASPCLLFIDEIDGLCQTRSSGSQDSGVSDRVLTQFLSEMDGVEELSGVFVLAATNRLDRVDPALRRFGRFEKTIVLPLPDEAGRREILTVHLRHKPTETDIDLSLFAAKTQGFSGADLAAMCSEAARAALRRAVNASSQIETVSERGRIVLTVSDLELGLQATKKQVEGRLPDAEN